MPKKIKADVCPVCFQPKGRLRKKNAQGHVVAFHTKCWDEYVEMSPVRGFKVAYTDAD